MRFLGGALHDPGEAVRVVVGVGPVDRAAHPWSVCPRVDPGRTTTSSCKGLYCPLFRMVESVLQLVCLPLLDLVFYSLHAVNHNVKFRFRDPQGCTDTVKISGERIKEFAPHHFIADFVFRVGAAGSLYAASVAAIGSSGFITILMNSMRMVLLPDELAEALRRLARVVDVLDRGLRL